jgi:hypothetical protein
LDPYVLASWACRIPDPNIATKERGKTKFVALLFVATNIKKLRIILFLKW